MVKEAAPDAPRRLAESIAVNLDLLRSRHAVVAGAIVVAFLAWALAGGGVPGARDLANTTWLVATGSIALVLFAVLYAYPLRKYAQRRGYSPELAFEVPIERLERAKSRLAEVGLRAAAGELRDRKAIDSEVRQVLREERCGRVLRGRVVEESTSAGTRYRVETTWREPLGRMSRWMHAHLWYGIAAAFIVLLHGGGRAGSLLGFLLELSSFLVFATGTAGAVLWIVGPSWLSRRERDASIEKVGALRRHYARKVASQRARVGELAGAGAGGSDLVARIDALGRAGARFANLASAVLDELPPALREHEREVRDLVVLYGQERNVKREERELRRYWLMLHAWRAVHVPAAIVLGGLVVVHVIAVCWY